MGYLPMETNDHQESNVSKNSKKNNDLYVVDDHLVEEQ